MYDEFVWSGPSNKCAWKYSMPVQSVKTYFLKFITKGGTKKNQKAGTENKED